MILESRSLSQCLNQGEEDPSVAQQQAGSEAHEHLCGEASKSASSKSP